MPGAVQVSGLLTFREHRAGLNKRTRYVPRSGMGNGRRVRLSAKCAEIGARIHRTCQWHMSNILLVTCLPCRQHFDGRVCAGRAREWQAYCMQFGLIMRLSTHYQRFLQECILLLTLLCCRTIKVTVARRLRKADRAHSISGGEADQSEYPKRRAQWHRTKEIRRFGEAGAKGRKRQHSDGGQTSRRR